MMLWTPHRLAATLFAFIFLLTLLSSTAAATKEDIPSPPAPCVDLMDHLEAQNADMRREMRRVHRELAALRADLEEPGLQEAFSGIGYILGLFGVAFFFANRSSRQKD